jgi:hypothetical protein
MTPLSCGSRRPHARTNTRREFLLGESLTQIEDPARHLVLSRGYLQSVDEQKRAHCDMRHALVPVEKGLPLGDAMNKNSSLKREIGIFIVRVVHGAS